MARRYKGLTGQTARKLFALKGNRIKESQAQRDEMAYTLRLSAEPRMRLVADWCFDPLQRDVSFAKLVERAGMDWRDIAREYKALKRSQGEVAAAKYIPVLMEQTAQEALSRDVPCRKCSGTGNVEVKASPDAEPQTVPCDRCDASGIVHVKGDLDRLKLMFDTYGLVAKGSGPSVNLDLRTVAPGEQLGALAKSVSGIVEGNARVRPNDPSDDEGPVQ